MKLASPSGLTYGATACCPLPLFADDCFAAASERRGRRCPAGTHAGAVGAARRRQCAARSGLASQNSLRSLRSLRSDSRDESDDDARCARRARPCAAPRPRRVPPAAKHPGWWFSLRTPETLQQRRVWQVPGASMASRRTVAVVWSTPDVSTKAGAGRLRRASEAPRSAGLVAARAARIVHLTRRRCLNAVSAANEVSSATRPRDRVPQGQSVRSADRLREALRPARIRLCRSDIAAFAGKRRRTSETGSRSFSPAAAGAARPAPAPARVQCRRRRCGRRASRAG